MQQFFRGLLVALTIAIAGCQTTNYRLPTNVIPVHYDLNLTYLDETEPVFSGEILIEVKVVEETSSIVFHTSGLNIDTSTATVTSDAKVAQPIGGTNYDEDTEFYTLSFAKALEPGQYSIYLKYTGVLTDQYTGFFRLEYPTNSGESRRVVGTFFTPNTARSAYPCFDEPALKATFSLKIIHPANYTALFSTNAVSVSPVEYDTKHMVQTSFETTPKISTYAIGFIITELESVSNKKGDITLWSRPGTSDSTAYGLTIFEEIRAAFDDYINLKLSSFIPKINEVALAVGPQGATETFGLPTYAEAQVLFKEGVSATRDKQFVTTSAAYEIARQYFGNLVTFSWWNHVWLSEGISTYFQYHAAALAKPDWRLPELFIVDYVHTAMMNDRPDDTRAVTELDSDAPSEQGTVYDLVTWDKGASLIRMISYIISDSVLQKGLQNFIAKYAFDDANQDDFWSALQEAIGSEDGTPYGPLKTAMESWTSQKGYPLVTVTKNSAAKTITIKQEPYLAHGRESSNSTTKAGWWIPISYATQSNPKFDNATPTNWVAPENKISELAIEVADTEWIILNIQESGFYRVTYDENNWKLIADYLQTSEFTKIHPGNRAQLIDDALRLASAGYIGYDVALPITKYLTQETDYMPWLAAFKALLDLKHQIVNSKIYPNFKAYVLSIVKPIHTSLGYDVQPTDEHLTAYLRITSGYWHCDMGGDDCNAEADNLMLKYYQSNDDSTIRPDLREWAYCVGMRRANQSVWNFLWEKYLVADVAGEVDQLLSGLGCSENAEISYNFLKLSITEDPRIPIRERLLMFDYTWTGVPSNVDVAFDFLLENFEAASKGYGGASVVGGMLGSLASRIVRPEQLTRLEEFFKANGEQLGSGDAAVQRVKQNIAWVEKHESAIGEWLEKNLPSS